MMYYNQGGSGADVAAGAGSAASKANPIIAAGEVIGKLTVDAIDASKRRAMDYNLSQQRLTNELGLAKNAQEQQYNLGKLNILAQAQAGASQGGRTSKDNSKLYLAIGVGSFVVLGTLMYVVLNK
jgi:hypothetical protein